MEDMEWGSFIMAPRRGRGGRGRGNGRGSGRGDAYAGSDDTYEPFGRGRGTGRAGPHS